MSGLNWLEIVAYFLCLAAIALLATASTGQLGKSLKPKESFIKQVAFAVLVVCGIYWYVSIPVAGNYYNSYEPLPYSGSIESVSDIDQHIRDHQHRLESLERELKKQREESEQLIKHYERVFFLLLYGLMYFGSMTIFAKKNSGPPEDLIKLDLDK